MPIAMNDAGDVVFLNDAGAWEPARVAQNPSTGERLAWDGRAWAAAPMPKPPAYGSDQYIAGLAKEFGASPEDIRARVDSSTSAAAVEGMPILGPALTHHVGPALSAAVQPLTGAGASGATFSERRQRNAELDKRMREDFDREHPVLSTTSGLIGGAAALGATGLTAAGARLLGAGADTMLGAVGRGALSGGVIGGADAVTRGHDAAEGAALGAGLGFGAPIVGRAIGAAAAPIISNIRARVNPAGYTQGQFARVAEESGLTPQEIADAVTQASAEGQGQFAVADALGRAGQRALSAVARAPGEGRQAVVDFLEQRQAGQGRRVANQLSEGFASPETAAQTEARLTAQRSADAARNYGAARGSAGAVDVTPAIAQIDETLQPGITGLARPQTAIADDSIEAVLRRARGLLTDGRSQISDFDAAFRAKLELDNMIDGARPTAQRLLIPVRNALDDELAAASQPYATARDRFRQQSQAIGAVAQGRQAAMRGRAEDTIPAFQAMRPDDQAAFRAGYVDPLIESAQSAAVGVNKAKPLTSDAFQAEAEAMAPRGPLTAFPIRESQREAMLRAMTGHSQIVRLDAAQARNIAEQQMREPLIWSEAKANALRRAGYAEGYPALRVERGRIGIEDGRHRIAVAAERGQGIEVAVRTPEDAAALRQVASGNPERAQRMLRQIGRENTMFETRRQATGGSQTADNLADAAALGDAPAIAHQLLTGNWGGAARTLVSAIGRHATGSTPEVRQEMARLLLLHGGSVTGQELQRILNQALDQVRQNRTRALLAASIAARDAQPALSR